MRMFTMLFTSTCTAEGICTTFGKDCLFFALLSLNCVLSGEQFVASAKCSSTAITLTTSSGFLSLCLSFVSLVLFYYLCAPYNVMWESLLNPM